MSLVFPTITSDISNILLIDYRVNDFQIFVDSVNSNTLPIVFNGDSSSNELLELFNTHFTTISRIGIVFEATRFGSVFLDNEPYFSLDETPNSNTEFLISLIGQFQVKNIDFLACSTLNMPNWKAFYDVLGQSTNVVVGASNNDTGNLQYGGDWILESSSQDIELIYFTESIEYYKYLLNGSPSSGQNAFILANDGTLYSSGGNGAGQLGLGPSVSDNSRNYWSTMLTTNTTGLTPKMISCGGVGDATTTTGVNVIVLMTDGSLFGCGGNDQGQLTNIASSTNLLTRMTNTTGLKPISVSAGGAKHTLVLMNDGTVWACGVGTNGQLGNGNTTSTTSLTKITNIPGTSPVIQVAAGGSYPYTMVLCSNGQIYLCGDIRGFPINGSLSAVATNSSFITMTMPTGNGIATKFSSSNSHMVILMSNGTIWGTSANNNNGNLGLNNNTTSILSLTQMLTTNATNSNISAGIYPIDVCCGSWWTLVLYSNGTVYGTGVNFEGELGIVGGGAFLKLTAVPGITGAVSLFANYAVSHILTSDGSVYSSGWNQFGSLALGTSNHNAMLYTFTKPTSTILPKTIKYLADSGVPKNGYAGSLANLRIVVGSSVYDPNESSVTTSKLQLTNAANTKLLFLGSSFVDNSTAAHTIAQIDSTDGGYISTTRFPSDIIRNAFYFTGSNPVGLSRIDLSFGTADFTIDFWFNADSFAGINGIVGRAGTGGLQVKINSSTVIRLDCASTSFVDYTVPTMTVNTWYNVILVRKFQNATYTHACFVNGIKHTSNTVGSSLSTNYSGNTQYIAAAENSGLAGYLANLRLISGTAVYDPSAANLTSTYPKTLLPNVTNTKLLLLGDSYVDLSPSLYTITDGGQVRTSSLGYLLDSDISGSYTFNGSNYITYTPSDISFGLADFTIECCFRVNSFGGPILGTSNSNGLSLYTNNSTSIILDVYNVGAISYTVPTMTTNTWYHLVLVRKLQSGNYTNALFLNGMKQTNTVSYLTYNMSGVSNRIGSSSFIGSVLNGSLTNLRVVVGTAMYDPNSPEIIPSFKKLTNVTNTKLLLLGESFVDSSTSAHTMTAGGVTIATFKY